MITEAANVCGAYEEECPTGAISLGDAIFVIDPSRWAECSSARDRRICAEACFVGDCVADLAGGCHRGGCDARFGRWQALGPTANPELSESWTAAAERGGLFGPRVEILYKEPAACTGLCGVLVRVASWRRGAHVAEGAERVQTGGNKPVVTRLELSPR